MIGRLFSRPDTAAERQITSTDPHRTDRRVDTPRDANPSPGIQDRSKTLIERVRDRMEAGKGRPSLPAVLDRPQAHRGGQIGLGVQNHRQEIVVDRDYYRNKTELFRCKTAWPTRIVYHDRPYAIPRQDRYVHMFYDAYGYPCHEMIWPTFQFGVWYHHGCDWAVNFVWPFYHRKYVFVSLDGWWPTDDLSLRYYWYGCHPYEWYGYNPVAREVQSDTYNYYTYNYYGTDGAAATSEPQKTIYGIPADQLRPRPRGTGQAGLSQTPGEPTVTDVWFENGAKAFESEQYAAAADEFRQAMESDASDRIVPFAYGQALFAAGRYAEAAEAVRKALARVSDQSQGVFYPRGLYKDDDTLYEHIDGLMNQIEKSPSDADLQLLLGYHLLGIGEAEKAIEPLQKAQQDPRNVQAAGVLMDLQRKITAAGAAEKMDRKGD